MCTCVGVLDFCADMKPCWSSLGPVWNSFESASASLRMCGARESLPPSCHRPVFFCLKPFWGLCEKKQAHEHISFACNCTFPWLSHSAQEIFGNSTGCCCRQAHQLQLVYTHGSTPKRTVCGCQWISIGWTCNSSWNTDSAWYYLRSLHTNTFEILTLHREDWVKFRIANDTHQDDLNIWIQIIVAVKHITCIRLEKFSRTPQGVVAVRHTP